MKLIICAVIAAVCALGWIITAFRSADRLWERDQALAKLAKLRATFADTQGDTQPLPVRPPVVFDPQPPLPAETVAQVLDALERHANGEGR